MKHTLSKTILALSVACALPAQAQLLITEMNSNASGGDFWEVTNFGATSIDLFSGATSWSWDDDSDVAGTVVLPLGLSIGAGESMVFLAGGLTDAAPFRTAWGLDNSVQVIGVAASPGLGGNDRVTLFDHAGVAVVSFNYAAAGFTRSNGDPSLGGHAGLSAGGASASQSAVWDPTSGTTPATARYTFADGETLGTYDAPDSDGFGSPGVTPVPEPSTFALAGLGAAGLLLARRRKG